MPIKTTLFDAADYLKTDEDIEAYLEAALEENDPVFFQKALGTVARAQGVQAVAARSSMTRAGVYKALSEEGNPSFGNVLKVVNALGYRLTVAGAKKAPGAAKRVRPDSATAKNATKKPTARANHAS